MSAPSDEELLKEAYHWLSVFRTKGYAVAPLLKKIAERVGWTDHLGLDFDDESERAKQVFEKLRRTDQP